MTMPTITLITGKTKTMATMAETTSVGMMGETISVETTEEMTSGETMEETSGGNGRGTVRHGRWRRQVEGTGSVLEDDRRVGDGVDIAWG